MAVGEFRNISGSNSVVLNRLGWQLDPGDILPFDNDDDFRDDLSFVKEVEDAVIAGDLEVRDGALAIVPLAAVQDFLRSDNVVTGEIQAQAVTKTKLDVSTPGDAVITQVVAGAGVSISETGVDSGTGEVTINASAAGQKTWLSYMCNRDDKWEKSGLTWMKHEEKVPHNEVGFYIPVATVLKYIWVTVDKVDNSEDWQIRLYRNPTTGSRVLVKNPVMVTGQRTYVFGPFTDALVAGEYGMAGRKNGGASNDSNFEMIAAGIVVEYVFP